MTVGYLMERMRELRAAPFEPQALYDELARLESMIATEIRGGSRVQLAVGDCEEDELAVGPPYDQMYEHWLCAVVDQKLMEYDTANTEMAIFNSLYSEYAKWYRRTHRPRRGAEVHGYV